MREWMPIEILSLGVLTIYRLQGQQNIPRIFGLQRLGDFLRIFWQIFPTRGVATQIKFELVLDGG